MWILDSGTGAAGGRRHGALYRKYRREITAPRFRFRLGGLSVRYRKLNTHTANLRLPATIGS